MCVRQADYANLLGSACSVCGEKCLPGNQVRCACVVL